MSKDIRIKLGTALEGTVMTKHEIDIIKKIPVSKGIYKIELDVHGYTVDQVQEILNKLLGIRGLYIQSISIIHGYRLGSIIKDYLSLEYNHHRLRLTKPDQSNLGVTHLMIEPEDKPAVSKKIRVKKKTAPIVKQKEGVEAFDENSFKLQMIQEKVKSNTGSDTRFNKAYLEFLNSEEAEFCKELAELGLLVQDFEHRLRGFYKSGETCFIMIAIKSVDQIKKSGILDSILNNWSDRDYVLIIQVRKQQRIKVENYIREKWPEFGLKEIEDGIELIKG